MKCSLVRHIECDVMLQIKNNVPFARKILLRDPGIAVSCEAMPVPGKYRSGCSQSSIEWNTGP